MAFRHSLSLHGFFGLFPTRPNSSSISEESRTAIVSLLMLYRVSLLRPIDGFRIGSVRFRARCLILTVALAGSGTPIPKLAEQ